MIEPLSPNTQAILLLTAPLIVGRHEASRELLTLGDYNRLARVLREKQKQPADLIGAGASEVIELCGPVFGRARLETLLGRGFLLSQAVERWNSRAIWVISRADVSYPKRLKIRLREDAPPVLYGCGDITLLEKGGLAVVGSRHVDDELTEYTEKVGRLSAGARRSVVSGGAKGIDQAAMHGALEAGGRVAGVMADSLERAALARDNREPLMDKRLVLISPYDPSAGFNVGHAMQRNKLIYALSDAALVVNSDFEKGGTWAGAVEQLDRFHFVPVFVRNGATTPRGNAALLQRGAKPWPNPQNSAELDAALIAAAKAVLAEPKQDSLPLMAKEEPQVYEPAPLEVESDHRALQEVKPQADLLKSAAEELFAAVRDILKRRPVEARTEEEIAELLAVTKPQAKAWLVQLVEEGTVEKVKKSKPARYVATTPADRLL